MGDQDLGSRDMFFLMFQVQILPSNLGASRPRVCYDVESTRVDIGLPSKFVNFF